MKIVFRVDSSSAIGGGHIVRCHTLAKILRQRGAKVTFVCRDHIGNLIENLIKDSFKVMVLPPPLLGAINSDDYAVWLGVDQIVDARETELALENEKPDWLIVDHYALDKKWEGKMRPFVKKIMVIDDLANRSHDCEILLDQNFSLKGHNRYTDLVIDDCCKLIGPRYALLHEDYSSYKKVQPKRDNEIQKILIYLGGIDPDNLICKALQALSAPSLSHIHVDVVVGNNDNLYREDVERHVASRPLTILHGPQQRLVYFISQSDLALGAGGATTWERLCLGLPSLLVSAADNQKQACESLARCNLINYAGSSSSLSVSALQSSFETLIIDQLKLEEQSSLGQALVDGLGALRVAEVISSSSTKDMTIRPAEKEDFLDSHGWEIADKLFQKPKTVAAMWESLRLEYLRMLSNPNFRSYVADLGGVIIGRVTFEKAEAAFIVNASFDALFATDIIKSEIICSAYNLVKSGKKIFISEDSGYYQWTSGYLVLRNTKCEFPLLGKSFSISILSDESSWINEYIQELVYGWLALGHSVCWVHEIDQLLTGDLCFYIACSKIVSKDVLGKFNNNLVIHESDLPKGKGWSPLTWQILENKNKIPVTLFEAEDKVDSGVIYDQEWINFEGHELIDELRCAQADATLNLCKRFVSNYPRAIGSNRTQAGDETFYKRRSPDDSELNPNKSIKDHFDLLRIVDNERYPAFFEQSGHLYQLKISKLLRDKRINKRTKV